MKFISNFFKALFSLRWIGLVMVLMAAILLMATLSQASQVFYNAMDHMDMLDILENEVSFDLGEMQVNEAHQVFFLEYDNQNDDTYRQAALDFNARIDEQLTNLSEYDFSTLLPENGGEVSQQIAAFNDQRSAHRDTFDQMVAAYQAGDNDQAQEFISQLADENDEMNQTLKDIIVQVEQDRSANLDEFPSAIQYDISVAAVGLALLLLLALVVYQLIAATTRPLHSLVNAVTAIGGDRYRPEILADLKKKGSPAGRLAAALDQLAVGLRERSAGLKSEIEQLRTELYESRRRRLKVARPSDHTQEIQ